MDETAIRRLPGGEIVLTGCADLEAQRDTAAASALRTASTRLAEVGISLPESSCPHPAAHHLYDLLSTENEDDAHSRYNAIVGRLVSFLQAAEHADRADESRIRALAKELGKVAPNPTAVYLTGGATAVLEGWRDSTIDVDMLIEPESDVVMRRLSELKEELQLNVKLASPLDFLPALPEWRERSRSRFREGAIEVYDFDFYSQALSKVARGFDLDLADVRAMLERRLVDPDRLRELYAAIEGELFRFPSVDPASLRKKLDRALG